MNRLKCSHILCRVNDIAMAVRDYERLGFAMQWGSDPARADNALLWFEEGPFIEFFQIPKSFAHFGVLLGLAKGAAAGKRWSAWARAGEGWCDAALEPEAEPVNWTAEDNRKQLEQIRMSVKRQGMDVSRLINGARMRPDEIKVRYSLFAPLSTGLPFVVSHYDSPQRPQSVRHPNGARKVEWVTFGLCGADSEAFHRLVPAEDRLRPVAAASSGVIEVGVSGLAGRLDERLLHGARITAAD